MSGDLGKIDFNFKNPVFPEISEKTGKILKGITAFVGTGLAIGVILGIIEAAGAGTLAGAFSAVGSAISAAMAATGPFLASAMTALGVLIVVNPLVTALIVGGAIVLAAVIIITIVVVKNSPTIQIEQLLQKEGLKDKEKVELRAHLMTLAEKGDIGTILNATHGKTLDREILFELDGEGNSVMSLLVERQISDCLKLVADKDKEVLKTLILDKGLRLDGEYIDPDTDLFLLGLAVIDWRFAKDVTAKISHYPEGSISSNILSERNIKMVALAVSTALVLDNNNAHLKACAKILENV